MEQTSEIEQVTNSTQELAASLYTDVREVVEGVKVVEMPFDRTRVYRRWEPEYGITTIPLLVKSDEGKIYDDKRLKGIFIHDKYMYLVSRKYTVFPNQEAEKLVHKFADERGLHVGEPRTSHFGNAMYWQVLDTDQVEIVDERNDDKVNIGCVVRNSLGAGVSLGADMFTYRLLCSNGAIAKGRDLGSISIRHVGNTNDMYRAFSEGLDDIMYRSKQLVNLYKLATRIIVDRKTAEEFKRLIPRRALPSCIQINEKTKKVELVANQTLWDAFNDVTHAAWHYQKAGFYTAKEITNGAHHVLISAVRGEL